ncbi:MAG TPA: TetR/AcrR family transcriptional regulator, partial [Mycobacterium sp.]|nr:TetR/AcrR family transcriptional regulator [Mycobacterium sp.]
GALDLRAPSIYRRFNSRDELLAAAIDRYVERVVGGRVRHYLEEAADPLHGIRQFFLSVIRPPRSPAAPRGCLLTTTSQQSSYGIPVIHDAVDRGLARIETGLRAALERAAAQGCDLASTTGDLAKALLQGFQGVLVLVRCGHEELELSVNTMLDALLKPNTPKGVSPQ